MKKILLSILVCLVAVPTFSQIKVLNDNSVGNIAYGVLSTNWSMLTNLMHADAAAQVAAAISGIATNTDSTNGVTGAQLTAAIAASTNQMHADAASQLGTALSYTNASVTTTNVQGALNTVYSALPGKLDSVTQNPVISCWGDSTTYGSGATHGYPYYLQLLSGVPTINNGLGGATSTQILTTFQAHPEQWGNLTIGWSGRNNFSSPTQVLSDVSAEVQSINHTNYLICSVINWPTETNTTEGYALITNLNAQLQSLYPNNFLDVRKWLISTNALLIAGVTPTTDDYRCIAQDDIPSSFVITNNGHLNDFGNLAVAYCIYSNWFPRAQAVKLAAKVSQSAVVSNATTAVTATTASQLVNGSSTLTKAGDGTWQSSVSMFAYPDNTCDLGNTTYRWRNGFFRGYVIADHVYASALSGDGSAVTSVSASSSKQLLDGTLWIGKSGDGVSWQVAGHLMSYPDNTFDCGNTTYRWRNGFFRGYVIADHFYGTVDTATAANTAAGLSVSNSAISRAVNGNFDVNTNLISTTGKNLGQPEYKWGTIFASNVNSQMLTGGCLIVSRASSPSLAELGGTNIVGEWYSQTTPPIFYATYYDYNSNEVTKGWTTNTWGDITNYVASATNTAVQTAKTYSDGNYQGSTNVAYSFVQSATNLLINSTIPAATNGVYQSSKAYTDAQVAGVSGGSVSTNISNLTNYFVTTGSNVTFYIGTHPNSTVTVYTNGSVVLGTNVICISPNGKIGLGVASPTYSLQSDSDIYTGHGNISTAYGNISTTGGHIDSTWMRANYFSATNAVYAKNIIVTNGVQFLSLSNTPGVLSVDSSGNVSAGPQTNGFYSTRGNGTAPTQVTETPVQDGGVYQVTYVNTNSQSQQVWWSGMCALIIVNPGANGLPQYVNVTSLVTTNYNFNYIATNSVSFHCILQQNESVQVWYPTWNTTIYKDSFFVKDL